MSHRSMRLAQILWPAFLVAVVLEAVVFAWVDPASFAWGRWGSEAPDALTVYSLAFFVFWGLVASASALSIAMLSRPRNALGSTRSARKRARRLMLAQQQAQH